MKLHDLHVNIQRHKQGSWLQQQIIGDLPLAECLLIS